MIEVIKQDDVGRWQWDNKLNIFSVVTLVLGIAVTSVSGWVWSVEGRMTVVEQRVQAHESVANEKFHGMQALEAAEMAQTSQHWVEISAQLARIEAGTNRNTAAIIRHIENTSEK